MTLRLLLRRRRLGHRACAVPTCPNPRTRRGLGIAAWCDDHTDSIYADADPDAPVYRREAAIRLGARRWLLHAEVTAQLERGHVPVLEEILAMGERERSYPLNRACWDTGAVKLSGRVDELLAIGLGAGGSA